MGKADATWALAIAAAALLASPAAGQSTGGGATVSTPAAPASATAPAVSPETGSAPSATTPVLVSPSLGSLADVDPGLTRRTAAPITIGTYAGSGSGLGLFEFGQVPLSLSDRPYAIQPAIGVEVLGTNNLFQTRQDARSDIVTTIAPSIAAAVSTSRLLGSLTYTPALRLYGTYSSQNAVDQIGGGQLLVAVVPDLFYVDIRGSASVQPQNGGVIPGSAQLVEGLNTTQTFNAQITPFLIHRFGTAATAQLGYSYQYSQQDWASGRNQGTNLSAQSYTANRGFAILRSGEDFGRLALQGRIDGTSFIGGGVYDGAHRFVTSVEGRYAILPSVAVLAEIGYENIEYGGTNAATIEGATWSIGTRLTPGPDSIIVVRYGRHDGFNSVMLNAGVVLGARTNVYATYSEQLSTGLSQSQDLLETITFDALGNPVDSRSGAPVILVNPFLAVSSALYRTRLGTATLQYRWPRDSFTLSATWQDSEPVSSAPGDPASPQSGAYGTFGWAHEFSARTIGITTLQYGRLSQDQISSTNQDIYSVSLTLLHRLSDNLTASAQLGWTRNTAEGPLGYTQTVLRAALRRTF